MNRLLSFSVVTRQSWEAQQPTGLSIENFWVGWVGFTLFPLASPFGFRSRDFGFCIRKFTNPLLLGSCEFPNLDSSFVASLFGVDFTFHFSCPCHLFQVSCFIVAAVTRSCLVSKLRFFLNSCDFKFLS